VGSTLEQGCTADAAQAVIVQLVATGGDTAIPAAAKFLKHTHGRAEVTVENHELDDDQDQ
jgi:hypothetical protein